MDKENKPNNTLDHNLSKKKKTTKQRKSSILQQKVNDQLEGEDDIIEQKHVTVTINDCHNCQSVIKPINESFDFGVAETHKKQIDSNHHHLQNSTAFMTPIAVRKQRQAMPENKKIVVNGYCQKVVPIKHQMTLKFGRAPANKSIKANQQRIGCCCLSIDSKSYLCNILCMSGFCLCIQTNNLLCYCPNYDCVLKYNCCKHKNDCNFEGCADLCQGCGTCAQLCPLCLNCGCECSHCNGCDCGGCDCGGCDCGGCDCGGCDCGGCDCDCDC